MFLLSYDYLEIKKTPNRGRGVFAKKNIPAGTVIGDYIGKVTPITDDDKYDTGNNMFLMYFNTRASLYPDSRKPGIHITNHSCTPNCWFYGYNGHILCFSLRTIFAGEELTVDYLLDPINKKCKPCKHACKCGEVLCRGTWHMNSKRAEAWWNFIKEQDKKFKRPTYKIGKDLPVLSSYPQHIEDNPIYTLFGYKNHPAELCEESILPAVSVLRQRIRETGKTLCFTALSMHIVGLQDNTIFAQHE